MITRRDYRSDPLYGIAVWGDGLDRLNQALKTPVFTLYLGRKSCPLSAPAAPRIVTAEDPAEALRHVALPPWRARAVADILATDAGVLPGGRSEIRHDVPRDRQGWHFAPRAEAIVPVDIRPGGPK